MDRINSTNPIKELNAVITFKNKKTAQNYLAGKVLDIEFDEEVSVYFDEVWVTDMTLVKNSNTLYISILSRCFPFLYGAIHIFLPVFLYVRQ